MSERHDCPNCEAQGNCELEPHVRATKDAMKAGGPTAVAAYVISQNHEPGVFQSALRMGLIAVGRKVENISAFREELYRLAKDQTPVFQTALPLVIRLLYDEIKIGAMTAAIAELAVLARALKVPAGLGVGRIDEDGSLDPDSLVVSPDMKGCSKPHGTLH